MNFDKTDEELKQMSEDEFLAYLDAKAQYLAKDKAPLSYHKRIQTTVRSDQTASESNSKSLTRLNRL